MNGCIIWQLATIPQLALGRIIDAKATNVSEDLKKRTQPSTEESAETVGEESTIADAELEQYALRTARLIALRMNAPSDAADDISQKALLRYHKLTKERRDQIDDLPAYLYRIIENEAADYIREQSPRSVISLETVEGGQAEFHKAGEYENIEFGILLREVWAKLKSDERSLLELLILGYNSKELSFRLGISAEAARQRTSRLRGKLKELLVESKAPSNKGERPSPD